MSRRLILSPHPDDAVLSLWHVLAGPGEVGVVNVFTAAPPGAEPGWWDELTGGADPGAREIERADEDRAALALAGRNATSLGFADRQYRTGAQPLDPVVEALAAIVSGAELLAPAALGSHPDHDLARSAALALRERGHPVALYADIPHAVRDGWPAWVANGAAPPAGGDGWAASFSGAGLSLADLQPEVHELDPAAQARKREAIGRYRTQVAALEEEFSLLARPELLRYEVVWALPAAR